MLWSGVFVSSKLEKFEELAEKRVTDIIKKFKLIGNLANRHNYDYTEEHVRQIIEALESELRILKNRFKEEAVSKEYTFSFKNKQSY